MKKTTLALIAHAIFFLFLIQLAGTLVESIYILDLMNTSLDEKALGILFFFSPLLLAFYRGKFPGRIAWPLALILIISRGLTPYLDTLGRMLASGIGTGSALSLLPFLLTARINDGSRSPASRRIAPGFALAIAFSALLRTAYFGLEYSLLPEGGWIGWVLGLGLGLSLTSLDRRGADQAPPKTRGANLSLAGVLMMIGLGWFAFSAPAVISRWTEGDYIWIIAGVSGLSLGWAGLDLFKPGWKNKITPFWLLGWNLLFTISLTLTITSHRVAFPQTPGSGPVLVGAPTLLQQIPLAVTILLFPVIFIDLSVFAKNIRLANIGIRQLVPGSLLGALMLVVLVFFQIFSNVWGYVEPVSPWFRNKFWLPYLLLAGGTAVLIAVIGVQQEEVDSEKTKRVSGGWAVFLPLILSATIAGGYFTTRVREQPADKDSLLVMTYNIQQANDIYGERSYREQLSLMREVNPDIIALQESDSTRISLNNNDYVRYYAGRLGYHAYYGPKTTAGSFGTAILSRYPLHNPLTIFSYSDQDEVGTTMIEVEISGNRFTIYNVHPDGSDAAMLTFAEVLIDHSSEKARVIALGDFNLRDYEAAYQQIDRVFTNAWTSVYPSEIGADGTDMSGENRIDHIFFSPNLRARNPVYILPPDSATDHPAHWAEILWDLP